MVNVLPPIEFILNKALAQDPETKAQLAALDGRAISLHFTDLAYVVTARFENSDIRLHAGTDESIDLSLSASMTALVKLGQHPDKLFSEEISIHGDVQFAKQLQDILTQFDFDWEALLAKFTGDALAYPIAHGLRQFGSWVKNNQESMQITIAEYLREEARLLPDKSELTPYLDGVDRLRADMDRLEARIKRLVG
jgi:ubiquinone biosynthesis protein UbiJ